MCGLIPPDHREVYDAKQVLARLCDQSLFWEVLPEVGEEMITGVGRVGGLYAGFIINRQGLVGDPEHPDKTAAGGDPVSGRDCEDQRVLAGLQRRRDPARVAAGHLRVRRRRGGGGAGPARVWVEPDLHEQHQRRTDVHGAAAQGVGSRILCDGRAAL
ncbi:MAG: hypothetical protein HC927_12230 [Deltaproteobacteria bacterium]|nr:hypothetical protein [Deltaproteobacteria bacterium]